jgi:tetratricopeptide (TPR) repeat protein
MRVQDSATVSGEPADFFISYTGNDVAWARWIAAQVEQAGFTTILQDWDWGPGANFIAQMHNALQQSSRLIIVASHDYLQSRWAEEEWTAAYYQSRDRIIPVCIEPLTLPGLLGPLTRIDISGLTEDEARDKLLAGLAKPAGREQPAPFPSQTRPPFPSQPWAMSNAPARNPEFQGRDHELEEVDTMLGSHKPVVISGVAGVGKTELATEYFHRHAPDASFAWWVSGENEELFVQALSSAAASLNLPSANQPIEELAARELIAWLSAHDGWLLVVDDAREPVVSDLLGLRNGRLLIATRNPAWTGTERVLLLDRWNRRHSVHYLRSRLPESAALDRLAASLGDLPLALTQARSYILTTGLTVDRYLALFEDRQHELLQRGDPGGHGRTLTATIQLALGEVSEDGRNLLVICSTYAPDPIPIEIFRSASQYPDVLPGPLSDELALEDAIAELRRLSLVQRDGPLVTVHNLVQRIVASEAAESQRRIAAIRGTAIVASAIPMWPDRPENWSQCERLLPHVLALLDHHDLDEMPEVSAWLLNRMGVYVGARGRRSQGAHMLERAKGFAEQSGDRGLLGSVLSNLGNAVAAEGDLDRGIDLVEQALVEKQASNSSPLLLARTIGSLGSLARRKGDFERAIQLHREALRLLEEDPDADDHIKAAERNDIGVVATELGLFEEAETMHARALETFERIQGPDGIEVGRTHAALALLNHERGNIREALAHQERAVGILQSQVEGREAEVSSLLSQLGLILIDLNRNDEAREALERAVTLAEVHLGSDHFELGFKLGNLGIALMNLGDMAGAIAAHERSLLILRNGLGDEHPSVVKQLVNLSTTHRKNGDLSRARDLLLAGAKLLLKDPPSGLRKGIVNHYTTLILRVGGWEPALSLLDDLIEEASQLDEASRKREFAWLASIYAKLGNWRGVVRCLRHA